MPGKHRPHPLLGSSGLVSTLCAAANASPAVWPSEPSELLELELKDGGTVSLEYFFSRASPADRPAVLILPGLGNSSETRYIRTTAVHLLQRGFRPLVLNYRGAHSGLRLTSPRCGASDAWEDLDEVLDSVSAAVGSEQPLHALGFSMGGGILARYLGEKGHACRIAAAACVSAPMDFSPSAVDGGATVLGQLCFGALAQAVKAQMLWRHLQWLRAEPAVDMRSLLLARDLLAIDEHLVCRKNGYPSVAAYRERGNPGSVLDRISVPLLVLNAADDPIVDPRKWSPAVVSALEANPLITTVLTPCGGHIAWGGSSSLAPFWGASWADSVVSCFLATGAVPTAVAAGPSLLARL